MNSGLFPAFRSVYSARMISMPHSRAAVARLVLVAGVLAAATGAAFAAWLNHGPAIFMAMIDTGLSWCF